MALRGAVTPFRNEAGRFITQSAAVNLGWTTAKGVRGCGRAQYKSRECKAKAIAASKQRGEAQYVSSSRQVAHVDWLTKQGRAVEGGDKYL